MFPVHSNSLRAVRPAFRFAIAQAQGTSSSGVIRQQLRHTRRWMSSVVPETASPSWLKRMWDSPVGFKTVHFWAPVMKWSIVLAGISDLYRPAEKLSLTQNLALTSTGLIWTRWCFIIKPRNILLATVNFFLGLVGIVQVSRIAAYNYGKDKSTKQKLLSSPELAEAADERDPKIQKAN